MIGTYTNIQQLLPLIIEGKVLCNSGVPVAGAMVYFVPKIEETLTTIGGEFKITTWTSLPLTLIVCHENYESYKYTVSNTSQKLVIKLKKK